MEQQDNTLPSIPSPAHEPIAPAASQDAPGRPIRPSPISGVSLPAGSQWKPGISPNPGGQPKGKRVSTRIMEMMNFSEEELDAVLKDKKREVRDHLAARALKRALRSDDGNADLGTVLERTEGKVAQDFTVRQAPALSPEQVAEQIKNAGLLEGGPGPAEF